MSRSGAGFKILVFAVALPALSSCRTGGNMVTDGMNSAPLSQSDASLLYVAKAGDTMTGSLFAPGIAVGTTTAPPTNGFIVSGNVGIGTPTPLWPLAISSTSAATAGPVFGSTQTLMLSPTATSTALATAGYFNANYNSTQVSTGTVTGVEGYAANATTGTIGTAEGLVGVVNNVSTGTITTSYELFLNTSNAGTITNQYGVYQSDVASQNYFAGKVGIGTSPTSLLHLAGGASAPAWTTNGVAIQEQAATYTDTTSSGTVPQTFINTIGQPTINASAATTYTTAATFEIAAQPAAGTNVTITNPLALGVTAGNSYFGGNVGIGTANPTLGPLQMGSGAYVTAGGVWTNASDRRLKDHIVDSRYGLNEILKLRPVDYVMKKDGEKQTGLIAQEVRKVIPDLVSGKEGDLKKGETLGLSYGNLAAVLVNGVKQLHGLYKELFDKVQGIYAKLTHHEAEIARLKAENAELRSMLQSRAPASVNADIRRINARSAAIEAWACSQSPRPAFCR